MGDGPSRTVKSPAKGAKTSEVVKMPLGTIVEAKGKGSKNAKIIEVSPSHKQTYGKSLISKTSLSSNHVVNSTSSSFSPRKPNPQRAYVCVPFRTIFNLKQNQPYEHELTKTSESEPVKKPRPYKPF